MEIHVYTWWTREYTEKYKYLSNTLYQPWFIIGVHIAGLCLTLMVLSFRFHGINYWKNAELPTLVVAP